MQRIRIAAVIAALALMAAACGGDDNGDTTATGATQGQAATGATGALAEFGESTDADPALIEKALGPVDPSDEASWNIILASIARADQDPDQATIDKAMECWSSKECDTGTGGDVVMGYADGGGDTVNVWRAVSHMEAILQALTYPEIGTIVSTAADFNPDPAVPANDIRFLIQRGVDFIVGYPDAGMAIADAIKEADDAGIPYVSFSAGWVGLPGQEGALVPGEDYLTVVGEDLCALGQSFAQVLDDGVGTGKVGAPRRNAGQRPVPRLAAMRHLRALGRARSGQSTGQLGHARPVTPLGNTPAIPASFQGLLTTDPDIKGYAYEYADGMYIGLQAYKDLGIPVKNLTVALRTDEQNLFCDWAERDEPTYNIWYSAGGNFQSRVGRHRGDDVAPGRRDPAEVVVPHVMRQVTAADCNPDRVNEAVSGTSLVPDTVLPAMFAN